MTRQTVRALAAGGAARGQYLVTHFEPVNLLAHLNDLTRKLVPYAKRLNAIAVTRRAEVVAVIHVQIRATDTAALHIQNDTVFCFQRRVWIRLKTNIARTVKYESFHLFILTLSTLYNGHSIRVFCYDVAQIHREVTASAAAL